MSLMVNQDVNYRLNLSIRSPSRLDLIEIIENSFSRIQFNSILHILPPLFELISSFILNSLYSMSTRPSSPLPLSSKFRYFFGPPSSNHLWNRSELFDLIYFFRQFLGIFFGVLFGSLPVIGLPALIAYVALSSGILLFYFTRILKGDEEEFGRFEILTEGFLPAFGIFMLGWISMFSLNLN